MPNFQDSVSYSRLSTYLNCAEMYRLKYVAKDEGRKITSKYKTLEEPLIKGNLAHNALEYYLNGTDKEDAVGLALSDWLENICHITPISGEPDMGEGVNLDKLEYYAKECGRLLMRCSESYVEEDKIRNKDGSAPKDPLNYMPGAFKQEYNQQDLFNAKFTIDNQAAAANNSFKRFSLANIAAEAVSYVYIFTLPDFVDNVASVELDLSKQKIGFNNNNLYWNGLLDTEYALKDGGLVINDHKTEKEKRRPEDVAFDLQLNSYAAVRYEQTGKLAEYIAITHLRSNTLIAATTSPSVVNQCMDYLEEIQEEINLQIETKGKNKHWLKKWPGKYGSPCFRRNWKSGALDSVCPYLTHCHPDYYECIKDEVDDFFGVQNEPI